MTEVHVTLLQETLKNIILSFSGLGLGATLWLAIYDIRKSFGKRGHARRLWFARGVFALTFVGIIGLLAEAIYKSDQPLPFEWRVILYTALIVLAAVSGIGVAYESRKVEEDD